MTSVDLTINGVAVNGEVEPRTHLADFLREHLLLTGTHLGCEHGVCGACTVLIDGEPARSCITFAATCEGRAVCSIEGLEDDTVMTALRAAFTAEHALQCGYCTPGMLVTARDIVMRLPAADDERIRLELAGNLCRCTGYNGIVRAIRRVLDLHLTVSAFERAPVAAGHFVHPAEEMPAEAPAAMSAPAAMPGGDGLVQILRLGLPADRVWQAVQDPALIAGCVPGARLLSAEPGRITGEMLVALGPIQARFDGEADLTYERAGRAGRVVGGGRDPASGTRLTAAADFQVAPDGDAASTIRLAVTYALQGPLAQFGRGPIVQVFAAEIATTVARNLEARLRGETVPDRPARLGAGRLILRVVWRWLCGLIS